MQGNNKNMCGIVAAISYKNVVHDLIEGLQRLEYRGYDSCGIATVSNGSFSRVRSISRVNELAEQVEKQGKLFKSTL